MRIYQAVLLALLLLPQQAAAEDIFGQHIADGIQKSIHYARNVTYLTNTYRRVNRRLDAITAREMAFATLKAAKRFRLPPELIVGVIIVESHAKPTAKSSCGARGLMQVRPVFWDKPLMAIGVIKTRTDYHDHVKGIYAGAYVLRHYLSKHKEDLPRALRAYSGGASNYHKKVNGHMQEVRKCLNEPH